MTGVGLLVVVPCGKAKIWAREPQAGPVAAAQAYTGPPFLAHRAYAEAAGDDWVVLSAKWGFLWPDDEVPGPYDVTFNDRRTRPIELLALRQQVRPRGLDGYAEVIGLGGEEYRAAVRVAFGLTGARLSFPFAGLPLGRMIQAVRAAVLDLSQASQLPCTS